jgi:hypothetical protein
MAHIPPEIFSELVSNPEINANQIAYKFNRPKSSAYRYIKIFKTIDLEEEFYIKHVTNFHKKRVEDETFDQFLFKSQLEFKCSRYTFNKLFLSFRERNKTKLKKLSLRICRSKHKRDRGFYTQKRIRKIPDYEV